MSQETQTGAPVNLEGWDGEGGGREGDGRKEGIYVYVLLIHVDI